MIPPTRTKSFLLFLSQLTIQYTKRLYKDACSSQVKLEYSIAESTIIPNRFLDTSLKRREVNPIVLNGRF